VDTTTLRQLAFRIDKEVGVSLDPKTVKGIAWGLGIEFKVTTGGFEIADADADRIIAFVRNHFAIAAVA
jgi:hypothetical protein